MYPFRLTDNAVKAQNCFLIKDLSFCTDVDYTVPGNPNVAAFNNDTALGALYDSYARDAYANFEKALAQVQCETDSTARYSLVKTCDDCRAAYKAWLCAVTIPRCEGFVESRTTPPGSFPVPESDPPHLQPRNVDKPFPDGTFLDQAIINAHPGAANRTSRNPAIDSILNPGPYKEVLPCADLCNSLVRSCPAALGFACPRPGEVGFRASYAEGTRCNYPGADPGRSMAVPALGEVRRGAMYALLMAVVTAGTLVAL